MADECGALGQGWSGGLCRGPRWHMPLSRPGKTLPVSELSAEPVLTPPGPVCVAASRASGSPQHLGSSSMPGLTAGVEEGNLCTEHQDLLTMHWACSLWAVPNPAQGMETLVQSFHNRPRHCCLGLGQVTVSDALLWLCMALPHPLRLGEREYNTSVAGGPECPVSCIHVALAVQ